MDLKTLQKRPKEYKVLSSTYKPTERTKEMIGKIFEVRYINYDKKYIELYIKDKLDFWVFSFSDVQEMTPLSFNGTRIGIGDMVRWSGDWHEVYCYQWDDGKWRVEVACNKNYDNCWTLNSDSLEDHKPLHNPKETITIGENTYLKTAFEEAIKDLRPVK